MWDGNRLALKGNHRHPFTLGTRITTIDKWIEEMADACYDVKVLGENDEDG